MSKGESPTPAMSESAAFRRVLLKISGETFIGPNPFGLDPDTVTGFAEEIADVHGLGVQLAIVVGGGNIFRGTLAQDLNMDRVTADHMGMLATVINSLALQDALEQRNVTTRVLTAMEIREMAEPFIRRRALRHLEKGRVVILAGGTGNPYFTTDSAASLRALELRCDVILKATKVDGVYDKDPMKHADAKHLREVSFDLAISDRLRVMDATALSMCRDNELPIIVFNLHKHGNIRKAVLGAAVGSRVS